MWEKIKTNHKLLLKECEKGDADRRIGRTRKIDNMIAGNAFPWTRGDEDRDNSP
jgi:hypothetical protein